MPNLAAKNEPKFGRMQALYPGGMASAGALAHVRPRSRLTWISHAERLKSTSAITRMLGSVGCTSICGSVWMRPGRMSDVTWMLGVTTGPRGAGWAVAGVTNAAISRHPMTARSTRRPMKSPPLSDNPRGISSPAAAGVQRRLLPRSRREAAGVRRRNVFLAGAGLSLVYVVVALATGWLAGGPERPLFDG